MSPGAREADPAAERDARRKAREARRGPHSEHPEVTSPAHARRLPDNARLRRGVVAGGIVGIAVAIAAVMSGQGAHGWLIGLVVSVVSLALAAAFGR